MQPAGQPAEGRREGPWCRVRGERGTQDASAETERSAQRGGKKGILDGGGSSGDLAEKEKRSATRWRRRRTPRNSGGGCRRAAGSSALRVKSRRKAPAWFWVTRDLRGAAGSRCSWPCEPPHLGREGRLIGTHIGWNPNRMEGSALAKTLPESWIFEVLRGNQHVAQGWVQGQATSREPC